MGGNELFFGHNIAEGGGGGDGETTGWAQSRKKNCR